MISHDDYWAHAHDSEQILYMSLASEFLDSSHEFQNVAWLQEWKAYWLDHKNTHANGCSDIQLSRFLPTIDRIELFRHFLHKYELWLQQLGVEISAHEINRKTDMPRRLKYVESCRIADLVAFATTIEDVLNGNVQNARVHLKPEVAQQRAAGDSQKPRT